MKSTLYLFNPDNDLALANGDENYVPSLKVRRMAADLALLPAWYAPEGASVLMPENAIAELVVQDSRGLLPAVRPVCKESLPGVTEVVPWGWNEMLKKQLCLSGVPIEFLPSEKKMEAIRRLSGRSFAVSLLNSLPRNEHLCGSPVCLYSYKEVKRFVESNGGCLLKAPWSGSGKGLFWCEGAYTYLAERWAGNVICKQGYLIGEQLYDKVEDFAMEFYSDGKGNVSFAGYSLFRTDGRGAYKGNLLASDGYISGYLEQFAAPGVLPELARMLQLKLALPVGGVYKGYLGVDMMVCRFADAPVYRIHPCVEVNLRMNMGMVARLFYDRFVYPSVRGTFSVDYFISNIALQTRHESERTAYPLVVEQGKIRSGYLPLTLINESARYLASVRIG